MTLFLLFVQVIFQCVPFFGAHILTYNRTADYFLGFFCICGVTSALYYPLHSFPEMTTPPYSGTVLAVGIAAVLHVIYFSFWFVFKATY